MATITVRRRRLQKAWLGAQQSMTRLDEQIGQLMGRRVDIENHMAEVLTELDHLTSLEQSLPGGFYGVVSKARMIGGTIEAPVMAVRWYVTLNGQVPSSPTAYKTEAAAKRRAAIRNLVR